MNQQLKRAIMLSFLFVMIFSSIVTKAQNSPILITVAVTPPYSTKISDYTSNPGKILVNVRNISPTGGTASIYLTGAITSESGISVSTEEGYKPMQPLVIPPGGSVMLNIDNIGDVFDENHLNYTGITESEILYGNGLPEDYYTICLRAWNYLTDEPLSGEDPSGCCSPFHVADIEPPIITQPICGEDVNALTPQNLIISWTHPAGAPITTKYLLTVVEVQPSDHSPEDAMNTARRPAFFQTTDIITGTSFIYGPGQPALIEGKTYAFRITAKDPSGATRFRNNGQSEVCSFSWKKEGMIAITEIGFNGKVNTEPVNIGGMTINPPPLMLPTIVKGRLNYKYSEPGDNKKYPLAGTNIKLVVGHVTGRSNDIEKCNPMSFHLPPNSTSSDPEFGKIIATARTDADGNFTFMFYDNTEYIQLATAGPEVGDARFRVALIDIETLHNNFYFNPEIYITPEEGKTNDLGTITTKVRSYELDITAKPAKTNNNYLDQSVGLEKLSSIKIYLCRKFDYTLQLFPEEDCRLKSGKYEVDEATRNKFANYGLQVLAEGVTGPDGVVKFQRVVWHQTSYFQYYIMAESDPESDLNFVFGAPITFKPPLTVGSGMNSVDYSAIKYTCFMPTYQVQSTDVFLEPLYPKIAGRVSSIEDLKPMGGVKVDINEPYIFNNPSDLSLMFPAYKQQQNQPLLNCISSNCGSYYNADLMITASNGVFVFDDLSMLFSISQKKVIHPYRTLLYSKDGYTTVESDIGILPFGRQKILNNITLKKGAILKGRVTDAESGDRVIAYIRQPDGKSYKCDRVTGAYEMPVLLLPGVTQQIIVEKNGYITDTIEFVANKAVNHLDIQLYQIKRRLKVYVHVKGEPFIPVPNCWVHILNVTNTQNGNNYPIGDFTDQDGIVNMSFQNGGIDENLIYKVKVGMHANTGTNFETQYYSVKIPVGKDPVIINCMLPRAACIKGHVYAGSGNESIVAIAKVQYKGYSDTLTSYSGADGYYYMNNFPVRNRAQLITALKSQSNFIGDEKHIKITSPSDVCTTVDFNLTVYDDMDITHLMGFPMEVSKLVADDGGGVKINGNLISLPSNEQFSTNTGKAIPFSNVYIKPGKMVNAKKVPIAEPVTLPVKTNINSMQNVMVLGSFSSELVSNDGILIDRMAPGSGYGVIKSRVKIPATEFNSNNVTLPDVWLASASSTGITKMLMPVFSADAAVKKPVTLPATGFWVCNNKGEALKYSFPKFPNGAVADLLKSFLVKDKIILNTILHTNCNNVTPADLNIKLGNVEITKTTITPKPVEPIKLTMGQWKLESSDWLIGTNGIVLNKSLIKGQMDINVQNLEITYNTINADKTVADFGSLKILGTIPVTITANNKGLSYIDSGNGSYVWQLYATNIDGSKAGYITGLPGLDGQDLPIALFRMFSSGAPPTFAPTGDLLKMYGLVDFVPIAGTSINIYDKATPPWFKVQGIYKPHLPYIEQFNGNIAWVKNGTQLKFRVDNPNSINFTHNNMLFEWQAGSIDIQPDLFTANGTATEPGKLGPVKIVLSHKAAATEIYIPPKEKIFITQNHDKYFDQVIGGMEVDKGQHAWNNFWFEGVMIGMGGISDNPNNSRVKFICEGDISADGQSVNVNKLDGFPGMSFTYDMPNSRLAGSISIDKDLMGMAAQGTANCLFDPNGWYLNIGGYLEVPGMGACGLFGMFGDYSATPPAITNTFGAMKCIPAEFQGKVSGFLLQGSLTRQLIPTIEWGVTLPVIDQFVGVQVKADLSMNARVWMSFDPLVNTYGIALLAEGKIVGEASGGVFNVGAFATAQLGIAGIYYSTGDYTVLGCGSVQAGTSAEVWTPAGWQGVDLTSPAIGLKMTISNNGCDFGLLLGSCGDNLCPDPPL